jgi:hypothetical protein
MYWRSKTNNSSLNSFDTAQRDAFYAPKSSEFEATLPNLIDTQIVALWRIKCTLLGYWKEKKPTTSPTHPAYHTNR